jgi:hypothetical protein
VFATGGYTGPGGKYDPAGIVHKGEFVFDQDTTKNLGVDLLTFLLKTKGKGSSGRNTIDPGMFGYAAGGAVRSMEETQAWAQAQAGKPYVFPLTGPGAYDCSGFTSALVNWALGAAYPYTRRHSSGTVGNDPALKPGSGGDRGLTIGAQPPYMISRAGNFVGHTTSSIGTLNAEATPPAVRVGGAARGASALPQQYFLPNFGGPNPSEQGVIDTLRALWHLVVPSAGTTPFAAMLHDLISELPHKVFDFLVTKVPQIIKDALVDVGATAALSANPIGQAAGVSAVCSTCSVTVAASSARRSSATAASLRFCGTAKANTSKASGAGVAVASPWRVTSSVTKGSSGSFAARSRRWRGGKSVAPCRPGWRDGVRSDTQRGDGRPGRADVPPIVVRARPDRPHRAHTSRHRWPRRDRR